MIVLGISCFYHDAAAALMIDGEFVAAAEEERFSRVKHDHGFPEQALAYCLREAGISLRDVDLLVFYEKPFLKFERILFTAIDTWPRSYRTFVKAMPSWLTQKQQFAKVVRRNVGYHGRIVFGEHHLSHASSAFLLSPFEEAAVLTVDGVGEWATTTIGRGEGSRVTLLKEIHFPHSLGLLYSTVTAHLGFRVNNDEYKVMGLAPYGKPRFADAMRRLVDIKPDGSFALDERYFDYTRRLRMYGRRYLEAFGPPRKPEGELLPEHADLAASAQVVLEESLFRLAEAAHREVPTLNLCLAGGVALNCVANSKIPSRTPFRRMFIQPAAGDSGGALGAAAFAYHHMLGCDGRRVMEHVYLGPSYQDWEIANFLDSHGIAAERLEEEELIGRTAELLRTDKVVGWFQGRMEFGPRALGSRSILANPCNPRMKELLNAKVKLREEFRPFAPSVLEERAREFFDIDHPSPFMLETAPVRPGARDRIPAVTHVDGSARLQTVSRRTNPRYHALIEAFGRLSGVPVVINTSFNVRGEPIVESPPQAYSTFKHTGIDALVLGSYLVFDKSAEVRVKRPNIELDENYRPARPPVVG